MNHVGSRFDSGHFHYEEIKMSATSQNLLEEIQKTEAALEECRLSGDHVALARISEILANLKQRFAAQAQALNEGRTLLKG